MVCEILTHALSPLLIVHHAPINLLDCQVYLSLNEQRNFISDVAAAVSSPAPSSAVDGGEGLPALMARLRKAIMQTSTGFGSNDPQAKPVPANRHARGDVTASSAAVPPSAAEGLLVEKLSSILGAKDLAQVRLSGIRGHVGGSAAGV